MGDELFTVIRNRDNTVDYVFNESLMDELFKPFLVHMEEQMITILVITDEQTEWERKFTNCMKNFARRYCQYEFHLKNEIFAIDIVRDIQCRCGKRYNVIILNKLIDEGVLPENWSSKDMGIIAKNLPKAIYVDCIKEEKETVDLIDNFGKLANGVSMNLARTILRERESNIT